MAVTTTEQTIHSLDIAKEEEIAAPIAVVFDTLLEQLGPLNEGAGRPSDTDEAGALAGRPMVS
jgi:hypothetical protein